MKIRKLGSHAYAPVNEDGYMPFLVTEWTTRPRKGKMGKLLKPPYFDVLHYTTKQHAKVACTDTLSLLMTAIWARDAKHAREIWALERVVVP